jgi:hypothetical protein
MLTPQRLRVILGLETKKVPAVLPQATHTCDGFQANQTLFPNPPVPLATARAQIQDLATAEQATKTGTKGTVAVRNAKLAVVVTTMESFRMYVQSQCDANPEQAALIAAAAGMSIAKSPGFAKPVLQAELGVQSGTVQLIANATLLAGRGVRKKTSFNWEVSADGGKTWTVVPSTPLTRTTVTGLTPLVTYAFRVCVTVSATTGEWSQAVLLLVR